MDGNGRWAKKRKHQPIFGHAEGAKTAKKIILECNQLKISYLSLFTLSTENIFRQDMELSFLVRLLERLLHRDSIFLIKENIQLSTLGDLSFFSSKIQNLLQEIKDKTSSNTGMNVILALNYGGQQEIVAGVKNLLSCYTKQNLLPTSEQKQDIKTEELLSASETKNYSKKKSRQESEKIKKNLSSKNERQDRYHLTENEFSKYLPSSQFPAPDLIIRSGGESRLSNFYLWSAAYSEFYFTPILWPDFSKKDLDIAIEKYTNTKRKFGVL